MNKNKILYRDEFKRICSAGLVGSFAFIIQFILFNLLRTIIHPLIANLIAIECAIITNFFFNNHVTFKQKISDKLTSQSLLGKFFKFNMLTAGGAAIQILVLYLGIKIMGRGFYIENMSVILGVALGFVVNYLGYRLVIWRIH